MDPFLFKQNDGEKGIRTPEAVTPYRLAVCYLTVRPSHRNILFDQFNIWRPILRGHLTSINWRRDRDSNSDAPFQTLLVFKTRLRPAGVNPS